MQQFRMWSVCISIVIAGLWGSVGSAKNTDVSRKLADRMGRIHAAAIYCNIEGAHDFGIDAMKYFKLKGNLESMREIYGLSLLNAIQNEPTPDIGTDCNGLSKIYENAWQSLKKNSEKMKKNRKKK